MEDGIMLLLGVLLGGFVSWVITYIYYIKARKEKRIAIVELNRFYLYNKPKSDIPGLEVKYNGKTIQNNFVILECLILNNGSSDIILDDSVRIKLSNNNSWESVIITNREDYGFLLEENKQYIKLYNKENKPKKRFKVNERIELRAFIQCNNEIHINGMLIENDIDNLEQDKNLYYHYDYLNQKDYNRNNKLRVLSNRIVSISFEIFLAICTVYNIYSLINKIKENVSISKCSFEIFIIFFGTLGLLIYSKKIYTEFKELKHFKLLERIFDGVE